MPKSIRQDATRFRTACQSDDALWKRVEPFAGLVRLDNVRLSGRHSQGKRLRHGGNRPAIQRHALHATQPDRTDRAVHAGAAGLRRPGRGEAEGRVEAEVGQGTARTEDLRHGLRVRGVLGAGGPVHVRAAAGSMGAVRSRRTPTRPASRRKEQPSTGKANETLIPDDPAERKTYAMRIIAQRCLYGVDKNPLAAEMAKLSLWLLTLAKDKPFEFLDHAIRCGDSLVGLHDIEQLRHFSLKPDADDAVLFKGPLDEAVDEAIKLRLKLEDMPANTVEDVERQEKLLKEANEKIARLRCAADLLVAAEFWGEECQGQVGEGSPRCCRVWPLRRERTDRGVRAECCQGTPGPDDVPLAAGIPRSDRQAWRI